MSEREHHDSFTPSGFFALRTPLLPIDELLTWSEGLDAPSALADLARLGEALVADRVRLRSRLRGMVARPEVREALFVASPELEERLDVWLHEPDSEAGQKMERALVRYFQRMAGRPTPFGLCAGCSVGSIDDDTRLILEGRDHYRRHSRLDMDYVVALAEALGHDASLRAALDYHANTSLVQARGRLRYEENRRGGKGWSHHRVAVEARDYLDAVLARAGRGAPVETLAAALLATDPEASRAEAEECVADLIDSQMLVSDLVPRMTGPEPIHDLVARLRERGAVSFAERLEQTRQELEVIDSRGIGVAPKVYREVARRLGELPAQVELPRLFQVDMVKPAPEAALGQAVVEELLHGAEVLRRIGRRPAVGLLARFREAFTARYEGREVPLVEALDEETGIGLDALEGQGRDASSLLDGLDFPRVTDENVPWGRREAFLFQKLGAALGDGAAEIALSPADLEALAVPDPLPMPDAFAVMASVGAAGDEALARGRFRVLIHGVDGPSGARLLGRFCHADPVLARHVERHLQAEEALQSSAVFAEIVHQPEGRLGNVVARPILRMYEIPYLGESGLPAGRQIPITDLRVSVVGKEIVLRSARLGRRVMPRLSSAHNYHASQGVYRFLCVLQGQGVAGGLSWDWGPLRDAPYLPRVVSGRLVLSRATWRVSQNELRNLGKATGADRFRAVQSWRTERRLPRWVCLTDADRELPIDLDNVLSVETFVELVKGQTEATVVELFPGPDELCVRGPEGRFVHEVIVPFVRLPEAAASRNGPAFKESMFAGRARSPSIQTAPICRSFPPGSEWLYAKLYTGAAMADQILQEVVRPITEEAVQSGAADGWFFIRYGDPDWHLRLRLHGAPERLQAVVWPALQTRLAPLLEDGRVWRLQLDTYEREVERYGGPEGMVLVEKLFQADSEAVLALLEAYPEDAREELRWRLALCGMDRLLTDLGFGLAMKSAVLKGARDDFAREFRTPATLKHQLGEKYRKESRKLRTVLCPGEGTGDSLTQGLAILHARSEKLATVIRDLKQCEMAGQLTEPLPGLARSFIHLHVNRLLRSAHRAQELVLYDLLSRWYESHMAQECPRGQSM